MSITLYEGGAFKAYSSVRPSRIMVNGKVISDYTFNDKQVTITISALRKPVISVYW